MQIPILSGIYTDEKVDYRVAYPINMRPIMKQTGISNGYFRPVDGIKKLAEGPGRSRGAINWNNEHFRVMGSTLCKILDDNTVVEIGDVGNDNKQVTLTYSFDRLAIASNNNLFYLTGNSLQQVTDPDLGAVLDVVWVDGYFLTTDGEFLVVTELNDPFMVNPLKFGSSEIDPDPVVAVVKLRNEIYAVNRYTIEVFTNVGGSNFPFQRIQGAQIQRGALGTHCNAVYEERLVFLGGAPGESPGIYIAANGTSQKISTREIDDILENYTEEQLSDVVFEVVNDRSHPLLWVRLPDRTVVFDGTATRLTEQGPVWFVMSSSETETVEPYRGIDVIWVYDNWQCGDFESSNVGELDDTISTHYGNKVRWEFSTQMLYNGSRGAIVHELELVSLPGRTAFGSDTYISTSYSLDGLSWSQPRILNIGTRGETQRRLVWRRQGGMRNYRIQRFVGSSDAYISVSRLEAQLEGLTA